MSEIPLILVCEDGLSEACMNKLVGLFDCKFVISACYCGGGYNYIKKNIKGFCLASKGTPFFVLTDLDEYDCPATLVFDWLGEEVQPNCLFRIAVREVEAWLLADKKGFAEYVGVSEYILPRNPEAEDDPKRSLIKVVSRSRKRSVREDVIPLNEYARVGPNYNDRLSEFVAKYWDVNNAMQNSDSLRRAYNKLRTFDFIRSC